MEQAIEGMRDDVWLLGRGAYRHDWNSILQPQVAVTHNQCQHEVASC